MSTLQEHQAVLLELLEEFGRICRKHHIPYVLFAGSALGAVRHKGFIPWDDDLDVLMLRPDYERFLQVAPTEVGDAYFVQSEFSEHWQLHYSKLRKNGTTCLEKYHPKDSETHQGIYIDIFHCDSAADSRIGRKLQYLASRVVLAKTLSGRGYETDSILKKFFIAGCRLLPLKWFYHFAARCEKRQSAMVHTFFTGTSKFEKGILPRSWITETEEMPFEHLLEPVSKHYDKLLKTLYGDYMTLPSEDERKCKVHALLVDVERPYTEYEHYRDGMKFDVYTRSIR